MQIPRSLINEFNARINYLSASAQVSAQKALDTSIASWDGVEIAALRESVSEALDLVCASYADISAAHGAEFYDDMRALQNVKTPYQAKVYSGYQTEATNGAVKALIKDVAETGRTDRFRDRLIARADTQTRRAANMDIAYNTAKDPAKPKYARIPFGETCGFCLMLASFGFHYNTTEAASHAHLHCDCRAVPGFGETSVEDYDSESMYAKQQQAVDALGGQAGLRDQFDALPKDVRDGYIRRHGNKVSKARQAYANGQISKYIEQNRDWFLE